MSKKHSLPESLEQLLDTMCNTFGGIMFIAISLIVISQLVAKQFQKMDPEEMQNEKIEQLSQQIEKLQAEILILKQKEIEARFSVKDSSPEKKKLILQLAEKVKQNAVTLSEIDQLKLEIMTNAELLKRLEETLKVTQQEQAQKKQRLDENKEKQKKQRDDLQKKIAEQEKELEKTHPRNLRFGREVATNLSPYWIILHENKLYRFTPTSGDVEIQEKGDVIQVIPVRGTSLSSSPESELHYIFKGISPSNHFVALVSDEHSFSALLITKQFLRNKGYRVSWNINPLYRFYRSSNVRYKASE